MLDTKEARRLGGGTINELCDEVERLREQLELRKVSVRNQADIIKELRSDLVAVRNTVSWLKAQLADAPQVKNTKWYFRSRRIFLETNNERDTVSFKRWAEGIMEERWSNIDCSKVDGKIIQNEQSTAYKYRKKPVVVEAFQMTEGNYLDNGIWPEWLMEAWHKIPGTEGGLWSGRGCLYVYTLEGVLKVSYCDWIIRGVKGELYPCKPDVFEKTYEAMER